MSKLEIDKFNGSNDFNLWRIKMKALLVHNGLSDSISRERLAMIGDLDGPRVREMLMKAHSLILLSLSDEVLREVAEEETALGVWEKLELLFLRKSLANRLLLKKQLYSMQMEEGAELKRHLDEFNRLILDLRSVEVKIHEEDQAIILLSSLPKSYEGIVDTLVYGKDTLDMNEVRSALSSKEIQRKTSTMEGKSEMMYVQDGRGRSKQRGKGKVQGNWRSKSKHGERRCYHCNEVGHFKRFCPKLKKTWKDASNGDGASSNVVADEGEAEYGEVLVASTSANENVWVMDSGCTYHMTSHKEWFVDLEVSKDFVKLGDGSLCKVEGVGSIAFALHDGSNRVLHGVRYVPCLEMNLISLSMLDCCQLSIKIRNGSLKVLKGCMVYMKGTRSLGMVYILQGRALDGNFQITNSPRNSDTSLWHHWSGHLNHDGLKVLCKEGSFMGNKMVDMPFYEACVYVETNKVSFDLTSCFSNKILEVVHIGLYGPISTKSKGGASYFSIIVDDHSRRVWMFPLRSKNDMFKCFVDWLHSMKSLCGRNIKMLVGGKGMEFCCDSFKGLCTSEGMEWQDPRFSSCYQDGVIGCVVKTLVGNLWCMLKSSGLHMEM